MKESNEKPINLDRYHSFKDRFDKYIETVNPDLVDKIYFSVFPQQVALLRAKYPDATSYAFFHLFGGSTINESIRPILYEDFPGEDSVELFIDNLMNQK